MGENWNRPRNQSEEEGLGCKSPLGNNEDPEIGPLHCYAHCLGITREQRRQLKCTRPACIYRILIVVLSMYNFKDLDQIIPSALAVTARRPRTTSKRVSLARRKSTT